MRETTGLPYGVALNCEYGRGELCSLAKLLAIALSVTVNRATSPEGRGFKVRSPKHP